MADKHINIKLGTKFNGGGISAAMRALKNLTRGATDIKSAFGMVSGAISKAFSVFGSAFKFETQTTQFKTLIGNIDEAKAHMADLKALGDTPPFSLDQFAAASRSLMVMTDGVLGYKKSLELIGDAAAATGQPIEQMGHAVGRLFAIIRDGQPISRATMQLRNMGVITPEVAAKLDDMQKSGASAAEMWAEVEKALGKYNGAMKETEQTGDGLVGAIKTRWDNIVRAFGEAFADTAKDGMGALLDKAKELEESGTLAVWASRVGDALKSTVEGIKTAIGWIGKLTKAYQWVREQAAQGGAYIGGVIGAKMGGASWKDALKAGESEMNQKAKEQADDKKATAAKEEQIRKETAQKIARRNAEAEAESAKRAAEEERRIKDALAEGQRKIEERNAEDAAKKRERLDRELHQKRMADLRAEIELQKKAAEPLRAVASAAQSEFDRAFAMYRNPEQAAAQIAEERDYAADLKRLHKDASRYGGKWRIDDLAALMSAGDTQGVQARLEEWRKSKSFTPEVESLVRASAAEQTKTTAEDELRKLNDKTGELTTKLETLAATRDAKLDGIEKNTNQLAAKVDELLSVKG